MNITPAQLGFLRAIGAIVLMSVLTFLGDSSHLNGIVSAGTATIIAGLALSLEHYFEQMTGKAMFGAVTMK